MENQSQLLARYLVEKPTNDLFEYYKNIEENNKNIEKKL